MTLVGSNGAGKTTTLRTILGHRAPRQGSVTFNGQRLDTLTTDRIVRLGIAQSPEGRRIFPRMTRAARTSSSARSRGRTASDPARPRARAHALPAAERARRQKGGTLSGGEQQMLAIGRALMARPTLLLLDEPSMGLVADPRRARSSRSSRTSTVQGTTILLVEQNARMALRVAHRGYVMQTGRIVLQDTAAELLRSDLVRKTYLGER